MREMLQNLLRGLEKKLVENTFILAFFATQTKIHIK